MKMEIRIFNNDEQIFSTDSPTEAFFYYQMRSFNELTHKDAVLAASLAVDLYLKDQNPTPIGHLSDYVGKHFERLNTMDSRWDMLYDFYDNYENEDYEIVNQYDNKGE